MTVAVDDGQLIPPAADLRDVVGRPANHLQLRLGGGCAVLGLQGVAAQRDNKSLWHGVTSFP